MVAVCCLAVGALLDVWNAAPELQDVTLHEFDSPEELLGHRSWDGSRCQVAVIGDLVERPEALAQRLHREDDSLAILILTSPERRALLEQRLQRTPFIGSSTRLHPLVDSRASVGVLRETLESVRCRRAWDADFAVLREDARMLGRTLPRTQRTLDVLLDRVPMGVVLVDALGRISAFNDLGGRYFGLERSGRGTRSLFSAVRDEDHAILTALLATPSDPHAGPGEIDLSPPLTPHRILRLQVAPIDPFAPREGLLLLAQDVTARQAMEAELFEARKLESVGRLAGGIAHDFNNLLTVILGYAEQVERSLHAGERDREALGQIRLAAQRAADLTAQLLTFARRKPITPVHLDVQREIGAGVHILQRLLGPEVELVLEIEDDLPEVWMDSTQFQQVLMNLCVNARDAMPKGGRLTVRARSVLSNELAIDGVRAVEIDVCDTGVGMDGETLQRVFEPFFTTKDVGRGTGLGLATSHGIVEQAGGRMRVASRLGDGSRFTLVLPAAPLHARR